MVWSPTSILVLLVVAAAAGACGWWLGRRPRGGSTVRRPAAASSRRRVRLTLESLDEDDPTRSPEVLHRAVIPLPDPAPAAGEAEPALADAGPSQGGTPINTAPGAVASSAAMPLQAPLPAPSVAPEAPSIADQARVAASPRTWRTAFTLGSLLFWLSLLVYAITRLVRLPSFPIYFFCDEAVQTVLAADFLRDGLRDYLGQPFPTYFANGSLFNLSTSVYLQVLPTLLFGKSIWVTRGAAAVATILGTAGAGLILRDIFRARTWWMGVLLLAVTPAWYLHSRTAFETGLMVSFYVWFLYFYLRYRDGSPRMLYPALVCGALAFYSYSAGQPVVVGTGVLLLLSDARYHWQNRRVALRGMLVLAVLVLPYVRFRMTHGEETYFHLRMLDTFLLQDIPAGEKLATFWRNYVRGISPAYWYFPNAHDLPRHLMKGYGNIHRLTLPFAALGLLISLRRIRSATHRVLLASLVATPLGASIVGVGVTRLLSFVVPAALITGLGVEAVVAYLARRIPYAPMAIGLFALTSFGAFFMHADSLINGPTWYHEYGMGGMQYGASQLFSAVSEYVDEHPGTDVLVSPSWANGTDTLLRYFLPESAPVALGSPMSFTEEHLGLPPSLVIVASGEEYPKLIKSPKLTGFRIERILPYPDGTDGFYFLRMRYTPDAAAEFAREEAERNRPITEEVVVDGQVARVTHQALDSGNLGHIFDGDPFTLARGFDANPLVLQIEFAEPRSVDKVILTTGSMEYELVLTLYRAESGEPVTLSETYRGLPDDPTVEVTLGSELGPLRRIDLSFRDLNAGVLAKIHLREIHFE